MNAGRITVAMERNQIVERIFFFFALDFRMISESEKQNRAPDAVATKTTRTILS